MTDQKHAEKRTDSRSHCDAQHEIADSFSVTFLRNISGDDGAHRRRGDSVGKAVKQADTEHDVNIGRAEIEKRSRDFQNRSGKEHLFPAGLCHQRCGHKACQKSADGEHAGRQPGGTAGSVILYGGILRHDYHEKIIVQHEQKIDAGAQQKIFQSKVLFAP